VTYWHGNLLEDATYWPPVFTHASAGVTFGAPVPRKCRWEDRAEKFVDTEGKERISRAVVTVDADVEEFGRLYKGTSAASDPRTVASHPISFVERVPRLKVPTEREITAYL
jgi:hypothetical protein